MKTAFSILCAVCTLLVGCDTVNVAQYRIAAAGSSATDRAQVRGVLRAVAAQTKLSDQTPALRAPDTIVFYTQPNVEHFRLELGARAEGGDILVDLNAGFGPQPPEYKLAHRLLGPTLAQVFGSRASEIQRQPVPWQKPNHALQPTAGAVGRRP